jgi:hypothetical protein
MSNLYCDNYQTCNSYILDLGSTYKTEYRARAAGWHIFHGEDQSGKQHDAVLCGHCVDAKRRKLDPAPEPQRGQQELFSFEVIIE